MTRNSPLRVAIVGAGPSGFYAAAQLLAIDSPQFAVDLYDRLPTPYGLVRAGVAPDHPKIKSVTRAFDKTAEHERFRFLGHVEFGRDITRDQLLECYHAVCYAFGSAADKRLGIPGEDLHGVYSATEFVAWYNGHPDYSGLGVDLRARHAVVIGAGNVAIDVARMLALTPSELAVTDTADHARAALGASALEEITIVARRGPLQAAFTNPELLEIGDLKRADVEVVSGDLDEESIVALREADKTRRRNVEILTEYAARTRQGRPLVVRFRFLASPVELLRDDTNHVGAVLLEANTIARRDDGSLGVRGTGTYEEIPAELVFRSIGYSGRAIQGIPFDDVGGVIRNIGGRVVDVAGVAHMGEYVAGWIKRGPSGVIGTNKKDAVDTVARIVEDAAAGRLNTPTQHGVDSILTRHAKNVITWAGWRRIDAMESAAGAASAPARPRVKLVHWPALRLAASSESGADC